MKKLISAGIITFRMNNDDPEYLLLQYPHGHWDLPKGKVEKGESLKQAALRELKEETGISVGLLNGFEEQLEYVFKENGDLIKKTVVFFLGHTTEDSVALSHEHIGFEWLSYLHALNRLTFANAKRLLKQADHFLKH